MTKQQESVEKLRQLIQPGDTIYTKLIHVSRSGMSRVLDVYVMRDNAPQRITWSVADAIGASYSRKYEGVVMGGCGEDMGFACVYNLARVLFPDFRCVGKGCPSNDHNNYRRTVRCSGTIVYNPDGPNTGEPCAWNPKTREYTIHNDDGDEPAQCPTCKGKGGWPNPKRDVQKGGKHSDGGYALVQRWF